MPIDYDIDDGVIVVRMHGRVTTQDFEGYLSGTENDARYRPDLPRLVTLEDDATFPPSADIIKYAAKTHQRKLGPKVRFACITRTPLAKGLASMFMGNAGLGDNYQLFSDEITARAWLKQGS